VSEIRLYVSKLPGSGFERHTTRITIGAHYAYCSFYTKPIAWSKGCEDADYYLQHCCLLWYSSVIFENWRKEWRNFNKGRELQSAEKNVWIRRALLCLNMSESSDCAWRTGTFYGNAPLPPSPPPPLLWSHLYCLIPHNIRILNQRSLFLVWSFMSGRSMLCFKNRSGNGWDPPDRSRPWRPIGCAACRVCQHVEGKVISVPN
jgi:hypothetical protein